uniref:Uncharacterized protein n=1 Tax=Arundo donax TaxID=35708 RepID=A0A0A9BAU1_ARUDO
MMMLHQGRRLILQLLLYCLFMLRTTDVHGGLFLVIEQSNR